MNPRDIEIIIQAVRGAPDKSNSLPLHLLEPPSFTPYLSSTAHNVVAVELYPDLDRDYFLQTVYPEIRERMTNQGLSIHKNRAASIRNLVSEAPVMRPQITLL